MYPEYDDRAIRRYLDEAKEQIDVIDFRSSRRPRGRRQRRVRLEDKDNAEDDLAFSDGSKERSKRKKVDTAQRRSSRVGGADDGSASEQVPVKLAFPGNEFDRSETRTSGK